MNIRRFSQKTYLLSFLFVMLANVSIVIFLIHNVLAQTSSSDEFKDQLPIVVKVAKQTDNPLIITVINIDNLNTDYQLVNYSIQNVSNKPVRGYVILGQSKRTGKVNTNVLPINPFQTAAIIKGELIIERNNIKPDEIFYLSTDYVRFIDGSSFGEDSQQQSEYIIGGLYGSESAVEKSINLIETNELATLISMTEKPLVDIEVSLTQRIKNQK